VIAVARNTVLKNDASWPCGDKRHPFRLTRKLKTFDLSGCEITLPQSRVPSCVFQPSTGRVREDNLRTTTKDGKKIGFNELNDNR
jgi:hypothetical protein